LLCDLVFCVGGAGLEPALCGSIINPYALLPAPYVQPARCSPERFSRIALQLYIRC